MTGTTSQQSPAQPTASRVLDVELLYIDNTTCTRCTGTDANLAAALAAVESALAALGITATAHHALVTSIEQARQMGLVSSPTIRINGRDIAPYLEESTCGACSDLAGAPTLCRTWRYRGDDSTEAPVGLIVEAILRAAAGDPPESEQPPSAAAVPANLERFFAARSTDAACCSDAEQATCCAPTDKAACCGAPDSGQCGCRSASPRG